MGKKARICLFCMLFLCGCVRYEVKQNSDPIHEYGESAADIGKGEHYHYYIHSIHCEIEAINDKSEQLVKQLKKDFIKEAKQAENAELTIDWKSYLKEERYISILYQVETRFDDTSKTTYHAIHYDLKQSDFFDLEDVFGESGFAKIAQLSREQLRNRYPEQSDSLAFSIGSETLPQNFACFVLKKDQLELYFDQDMLYPFAVQVCLGYEMIDETMEKETVQTIVPYDDVLNEPLRLIDPDKPMVAITFDDGPLPRYTGAILDVLQEEQACATFFILGSRANLAPELLQRMILEGSEIGNHTYSHKQLTTLSRSAIKEEITRSQAALQAITGKAPKLLRPPYGSHNDVVDACMSENDLLYAGWSVDTQDWKLRDAQQITSRVLKEVRDGDIILMHDMYPSTVEALKAILSQLKEEGYQFVTVSELLQYREVPLPHG